MRRLLAVFFALVAVLGSARANWEYGDVYYDDGGRFIVGVRAGGAMPFGTMKNNLRAEAGICDDGTLFDGTPCDIAKVVDLGAFPLTKEFKEFAFAGGASVGMAVEHNPNIRLELDWLHIAESRFDADPLFESVENLSGLEWEPYPVLSAASSVQTDVVSAFVYYDFFNGQRKPPRTMIPYIGAGIGYATSATILTLADKYGDFGDDLDMHGFLEDGSNTNYYTSKTETNNIALSAAAGVAYGIGEGVYFDVGARASWIPRIRWALNNEAKEDKITFKERNIFSVENVVFVNIYAGLRFEF